MIGAVGERTEGGAPQEMDGVETVAAPGDREVAYAEYGAADGTPSIFFHGTPGSRVLARLLDEDARRHGVRLLAVDRPGHGRSTPWPTRTLSDTGAFVTAVMEDAGVSRVRVVGFSGGGPHALAFAAEHDRLVSSVDVISGTTPPSLTEKTPRVQRFLGTAARVSPLLLKGVFRTQAMVAERASSDFVVSQYATDRGSEEISGSDAEILRADLLEAFAVSTSGAVTESRLFAEDWDFSLEQVSRPVRLWHGERDTHVPVDAVRRLGDRLPNGRTVVFDDADHLTALDRSRRTIFRE